MPWYAVLVSPDHTMMKSSTSEPKSCVHAVLHAAAEAEQQHQHEDAPEHAERGEHGAQLVLPQRVEDFLQAVEHHQATGASADHAVAQHDLALRLVGDVLLVRHDDHRVAALMDVLEQLHDLLRRLAVERAGRLVGEDHRGLRDQRARDRDALLLAARHLGRHVIGASRAGRRGRGYCSARSVALAAARRPGSRAAARRSRRRS